MSGSVGLCDNASLSTTREASMKPVCAALTICLIFGTSASRYIALPGYAFRTDPTCQRTVSKLQFDRKCDWPKVGIKDFTPPSLVGIGF